MTRNKLLGLLGAMVMVAVASGCSSDSCSTNADCADKGSDFVCVNQACVQSTPNTTFSLGGTVTGASGTLVLHDSTASTSEDLTVNASGEFTFPTKLADGTAYTVTVKSAPAGQSCSVT